MLDLKIENLHVQLPESGNIPILSPIGKILMGLAGPLLRYDARANAANEIAVAKIASGELVDAGHAFIPKLEEIKGLPELLYHSDVKSRLDNLESNVKKAIEYLQSKEDSINEGPNGTPINPDWLARWRREAECIGTPEAQLIWSRILAEEALAPGKISYRTLEVLRNISPVEAKLFAQVAKFALENRIIPLEPDVSKTPFLFTYSMASALMDIGLISPLDAIGLSIHGITNNRELKNKALARGKGFCILLSGEAPISCGFIGYELTRAGRELLNIADIEVPSNDDIKEVFNYIVRHNRSKTHIKNIQAINMPNRNNINFDDVLFEVSIHPDI